MKLKIEEPVGILGVGVEGRSTIDYLRRHNIKDITALDKSPIDSLPNDISTIWGSEHDKNLERFAVIFRSPGIRPDHPQLVLAAKTGTQITSATSYFLECCNAPIIAITGTLGKGTACALTAHLLESVGHRVYLGGNIWKKPFRFFG